MVVSGRGPSGHSGTICANPELVGENVGSTGGAIQSVSSSAIISACLSTVSVASNCMSGG